MSALARFRRLQGLFPCAMRRGRRYQIPHACKALLRLEPLRMAAQSHLMVCLRQVQPATVRQRRSLALMGRGRTYQGAALI
jgi:hypothetical protein